jgi:ribonuclease E
LGHVAQLPGEQVQSLQNTDRIERLDRSDRTASSSITPVVQRSWDHGNEPFDQLGEDEYNSNLVNHPSYQEQTRLDKKRRRRHERTEESTVRDETERPIPRGATTPSVPLPIEESLPVEESDRPSKVAQNKPTRAPIEPPEQVSIAMSDAEKEVYAWMGVSPLIKLEQEVRNPRTAAITIVPLGSLPESQIIDTNDETLGLAEPIPQPVILESSATPVDSQPATQTTLPLVVPAENLAPAENSSELTNRRRRRRSSAVI